MFKIPIIDGRGVRRPAAVLLFLAGMAVLTADAWIRHVRCMTVGVILMVLSVMIFMMKNKGGKKNIIRSAAIYGLVFWMIMFVIVSIMLAFQIYHYPAAKAAILAVSGLLAYLFTRRTEPEKMMGAAFIGAVFAAIGLLLDAIITSRFDPQVFSSIYLWIGYLFVLVGAIAGGCVCSGAGRLKKRRHTK